MAIEGPDRQFSLALGRVGRHDRAQSPNPRDSALQVRHVERNAPPAGLVKRAEDWPWSNVHARRYGDEKRKNIRSPWPVAEPWRLSRLTAAQGRSGKNPRCHKKKPAVRVGGIVERNTACAEAPTSPIVPDTEQGNPSGGQKARRMMANPRAGKAASDIPAIKPYLGKPAARNFRRWRRWHHSTPGPRHCLTRPLVAPVRICAGGGQESPSLPRPFLFPSWSHKRPCSRSFRYKFRSLIPRILAALPRWPLLVSIANRMCAEFHFLKCRQSGVLSSYTGRRRDCRILKRSGEMLRQDLGTLTRSTRAASTT